MAPPTRKTVRHSHFVQYGYTNPDSAEFYKVTPSRNSGNDRPGSPAFPISRLFIYRSPVRRVPSTPQHRPSSLFLKANGTQSHRGKQNERHSEQLFVGPVRQAGGQAVAYMRVT